MTYIVNDACIKCKYLDCVEICPVDCFYEGENMIVIHPEQCIDCGLCMPLCPIDAIQPDTAAGAAAWVEMNRTYANAWPKITQNGDPYPDADKWATVKNKYPKHFNPQPAKRG